MANPTPQHNPTDGLGVAAYVHVTGSGVGSIGATFSGQGNGASSSGVLPNAQYGLILSLSSAGGKSNTCQLTASAVDAKNNAYSTVGSFVYKSYNNPSNGSPSWYKPSRGSSTGNSVSNYNDNVASVSSSGLITAIAVGQAIIEVQFPTFDNTIGNDANTGNPDEMIYAQIVVEVIA
jgi:hypothetical protein